MIFVSLTRLRIRSLRFLPSFSIHLLRTLSQVRKARGFRCGALLADRHWTFWTLTAWDDAENMREYMTAGAHKKVMPHLLNWCDEAAVAHWTQTEEELPAWMDAAQRLRESGRASKVRHPSSRHASLDYDAPRLTRSAPISPR